ncbi:MAG: NADH-quinone oxidoreductase subunit C, partial [Catenulispora sp.]|nr:NADH-quinone oxidoreductase subunit C [Catenulispora sp.]
MTDHDHESENWSESGEVQETFGERTVTVAPEAWLTTLERARQHGYTFFDWLTAVDEQDAGFDVFAHVAKVDGDDKAARLLIRTRIPQAKPELPSAVGVYRGANWHERETSEMFGVSFTGHPNLIPLLLPDGFDGHPLRKDFVLAARVAKEWPGVKEPGEGGPSHGAPAAPAAPAAAATGAAPAAARAGG